MKFVKESKSIVRCGIVALGVIAMSGVSCSSAAPPAKDNRGAAREQRTAWFREAKFGLFIHWGLYAIPAGEWKGQEISGIGEWIMNRAKIPVAEYAELAKQFNPVKFNAEEWVSLAKN